MKYIKKYKQHESVFVKQEDIDELLDKINLSGIESLDDIDKNRLTLFSDDDKEIIDIIEKMADVTNKFKVLNLRIRKESSEGKDAKYLMDDWMKLNSKLVPLEQSFRKYGIELGDARLTRLMTKVRPDAYNLDIDL